jgi:hypothetical protein
LASAEAEAAAAEADTAAAAEEARRALALEAAMKNEEKVVDAS